MAKTKINYVCTQCGAIQPKWMGKCPDCGSWNTLVENVEAPVSRFASSAVPQTAKSTVQKLEQIDSSEEQRYLTQMEELNRVLGGGIVPGSVVLLSGDPGIGKSTLLLQICQTISSDAQILYVSGEESLRQIKLRAARLGVTTPNLSLSSTTNIEAVIESIQSLKPDIVMVDSIQTMNLSALNSSSGSVTQVRECTQLLINIAKTMEIPVFIVGHVNKDGAIAGPKVMEHMVDAVLYFEGERNLSYRILRAIKNRYGSTNEIGVFEMGENGLDEVTNPSKAMLEGRPENVSGTCVACVIEGSRPILAEVQALVSKSGYAVPKRMATGFDYNRLSLILAVLEKRCGYFFGTLDAYINVVGGMKLDEPAADLPIALSLVSNLTDKVIPDDLVAFGEIGLAGEMRAVNRVLVRVKEAQRLGFKRCILPKQCIAAISAEVDIQLIGVSTLSQALSAAMA
ncbi:DNA repair protein RadA [Negativibacillus massiliensis]|mgnify:FL=1|uniref:DNA repair protein RadA n=1 Tax=Negativibacillus massiliensis TaxID=1871035 RepID=UPI0023F77AC2|nr:DNA repair protein RadA [Negativibacillus massiliensis]MDY4046529.1 DNA repair protein RadA [Negativibacillus massiliensis]